MKLRWIMRDGEKVLQTGVPYRGHPDIVCLEDVPTIDEDVE